ncbi:uncharacterized protein LOC116688230 [Etheostoma spectabile]|uniref:uncharacterized protein LOC116688230 n=1 Tax=Etheostoma spectabile TaxID=54343 RepID=UPI0013AFE137|nr:uncharacterized protein LOC116688230 [Etheostoma spectabile]XP_032369984.1 uncharacterized protein LOC116688230 [Etheostoma spectabile]
MITETDSVTLNCQTPPSVTVSQCYFYTLSGGIVRVFPCLQKLTGIELLKMAYKNSPVEVEVKCYYTVKVGELNSQSPDSDTSSITILTLLPPKLTVNPPMITETDSVTLNCQTPPSVTVSQCYFYTLRGGIVRVFSCLQKLTGIELLKMAYKNSPDEVEVKCYYTVKVGELKSQSPDSDTSAITIHNIVERKSSIIPTMPTFSMTKDIVERESSMTPTMPTFSLTKGLTVGRHGVSTLVTPVKRTSETWILKFVAVVTGCGVIVGVILLVSATLYNPKTVGSEEVKRQEPQNKNFDPYHVYYTIAEESAASALKGMVYSTVQTH